MSLYFKSEKLGSLYLDNADKNEFEKNELKKNFGILIDSFFVEYDKEKKGYLTEEEFGNCLKAFKLLFFIKLFKFYVIRCCLSMLEK